MQNGRSQKRLQTLDGASPYEITLAGEENRSKDNIFTNYDMNNFSLKYSPLADDTRHKALSTKAMKHKDLDFDNS